MQMLELVLSHTLPHLNARDLVRLTRTSHGVYRLVTALLPAHIVSLFGPQCLEQTASRHNILHMLYVLERSVGRPEYGSTRQLTNLFPERWETKESSKFKYQLVAADSIVGLERARTRGLQFHPHMINCARSVAMCEYLLAQGVPPTKMSLTIALSEDREEVADWMMARGLVACSMKELKASKAASEYALTHPQATPAFIRSLARAANHAYNHELARSLIERHGISSSEYFLRMTMKAPIEFAAWMLTQKLFSPAEVMHEAIVAQRQDIMHLVTIEPPVAVLEPLWGTPPVAQTLLSMVAKHGTLEMLDWALQQDWGQQLNVTVSAVQSGDVAKVRRVIDRYPVPDKIAKVALLSRHCTAELLQYLADRKMWASRHVVHCYLTGNFIGAHTNPAVVTWLKSHYWWM